MLIAFNKEEFLIKKKKSKRGREREVCQAFYSTKTIIFPSSSVILWLTILKSGCKIPISKNRREK